MEKLSVMYQTWVSDAVLDHVSRICVVVIVIYKTVMQVSKIESRPSVQIGILLQRRTLLDCNTWVIPLFHNSKREIQSRRSRRRRRWTRSAQSMTRSTVLYQSRFKPLGWPRAPGRE